jgi:hypothetical protein
MEHRIRHPKQVSVHNLRSHSISTFNHYDRRISTFNHDDRRMHDPEIDESGLIGRECVPGVYAPASRQVPRGCPAAAGS